MDIKVGDKMKYKIGEFSKIVNVPIKTLRYYDEIDLFNPATIDLYSGYRYYTSDQINDLHLILELKEAGFMLEEIKENWNQWEDEDFLIQKDKIYKEQENLYKKIRKIDELRTRLHDGVICTNPISSTLVKRKDLR